MSNKIIRDQFNKQAEKFANWSIGKNIEYLNGYYNFCDIQSSDKLLNVACGPGEFTIFIAKRILETRGVDISDREIEIANSLIKEFGLSNIGFDCSDVEKLPYKDNTLHFKRHVYMIIEKIAPDFEMNDINENIVKLSDLYSKSNYLLLDFWASHCGPCRKENANICKAYEMFCNKGFDVLGVSTDTKKELWLTAIEKDGLIWTNVSSLKKWGDNETVKTYALRQVSQNFLVDNSGKIIAKDLRGDELITKLDELLNLKRAKNK